MSPQLVQTETCVNCGGPVSRFGAIGPNDPTVVCESEGCGLVHMAQSLPQASVWECTSCGKKDSTYADDGPSVGHDPAEYPCKVTRYKHTWKQLKVGKRWDE